MNRHEIETKYGHHEAFNHPLVTEIKNDMLANGVEVILIGNHSMIWDDGVLEFISKSFRDAECACQAEDED